MSIFNDEGLGTDGEEEIGAEICIGILKKIDVEKTTPIAPFISYSKRHAAEVRHHELSTHIILDYHPHSNSASAVIDSDCSELYLFLVQYQFLDSGFYSLAVA